MASHEARRARREFACAPLGKARNSGLSPDLPEVDEGYVAALLALAGRPKPRSAEDRRREFKLKAPDAS